MAFTKLTKLHHYTDVICVGLSVSTKPYQFSNCSRLVNIHGFHTIHLRPKNGKLILTGDILTWDTTDLFSSILDYIPVGHNPLIVCNHSVVAVGSSDFVQLLDNKKIVISRSNKDSEEFGYKSDNDVCTECFISSSPPTIIMFQNIQNGRKYTLVDICNYGIDYISDVFDNLSTEEKGLVYNEAELGVSEDNSLTCAGLISRFMQEFYRIVTEHRLGGLSLTYSSQGMRNFRHSFYKNNILTHSDETATILERGCYTGGRVEERYHGNYEGKVYLLDVQSLYPSIGARKPFPIALQETIPTPSRRAIEEKINTHCIFASVYLETDKPAYPVKIDGVLRFPIGSFNTFLCADEFTEAWKTGVIKHVYYAAFYRQDYILRELCSHMLSLRSSYKGANNRLAEFIIKLITNGTWGKFGQTGRVWVVDEREIADCPYGGYCKHEIGKDESIQYRIIDYVVSRLTHVPFPDNTFTPISAAMNAYSRMYLWRAMELAGLHNVLYTCVDGIIVLQEGYDRLENYIARNPYEYGKFKVSERGEWATIAGYGKYTIGNKVCHQGLPRKTSKRYSGFWSVLDRVNQEVKNDILSGYTVLESFSAKYLRDKLRLKQSEPGFFTVQDAVYQGILKDNQIPSLNQGQLFHSPEWLR